MATQTQDRSSSRSSADGRAPDAPTGLRLGWTVIDPGPRPRGRALAEEGRASVTIALGLIVILLTSGVIEAFVTPSPLATWVMPRRS